jgi:hypothetical protein
MVETSRKENIEVISSTFGGCWTTHRLEIILREARLPINVNDILTDDEPDIAPKPEAMHFTDTGLVFFCVADLSFTDILACGCDAGSSTSQPFTQGYPHIHDS